MAENHPVLPGNQHVCTAIDSRLRKIMIAGALFGIGIVILVLTWLNASTLDVFEDLTNLFAAIGSMSTALGLTLGIPNAIKLHQLVTNPGSVKSLDTGGNREDNLRKQLEN